MTVEKLRTVREANPFVPFTIHMADGRSHSVPHRDYLSMFPSGRCAIVYRPDDTWSVLDLLLVTELSMEVPSKAQVV